LFPGNNTVGHSERVKHGRREMSGLPGIVESPSENLALGGEGKTKEN